MTCDLCFVPAIHFWTEKDGKMILMNSNVITISLWKLYHRTFDLNYLYFVTVDLKECCLFILKEFHPTYHHTGWISH